MHCPEGQTPFAWHCLRTLSPTECPTNPSVFLPCGTGSLALYDLCLGIASAEREDPQWNCGTHTLYQVVPSPQQWCPTFFDELAPLLPPLPSRLLPSSGKLSVQDSEESLPSAAHALATSGAASSPPGQRKEASRELRWDLLRNRRPPPSPPPPAVRHRMLAPAPMWTILTGAQFCELTNNGACITDGPGNYGDNEECTAVANINFYATATQMDVE